MSSASKVLNYKKRSGCATLSGPLYEIKMAALLFLRGLISGHDFQLATNVDGAGALDDVVFRYKTLGGPWVTSFIQAKHTNRSKLSLAMLTAKSGDFASPKYFEAYNEIREYMSSQTDCDDLFGGDIKNCIFVLFTNLESNDDFKSVHNKIPPGLDCFLSSESGSVLCFNADGKTNAERAVMDCLGDGQDERAFLDKLVVLCGQPKENELGELIKAELETYELDADRSDVSIDLLCDSFLENVRDWCENGKIVLTKESDILNKSRDSVLAASCHYQERKKNTLDVFFNDVALLPLQNVLKEAFSLLLVESCECRLSATKLLQAFRGTCSILSLESFIESRSTYALKWRKSKDIVIVLCVKQLPSSMSLLNFIETIRNVLKIAQQSHKRVVIVSGLESGLGLATELTDEFKGGFVKFQDTFAFSQMKESSRVIILEKAVLHQGYETTILQTIGDCGQLNKILDALSVIEIMNTDGQLLIGPDLAEEIAYYIPRFAERAITLKDSILLDEILSESIAIVVSSIDDIKTLFMRIDKMVSDEHFDEKMLKHSQSAFVPNKEYNEVIVGEEFVLGTKKCSLVRLCHWKEVEFVLRVFSQTNSTEEGICPGSFLFVLKETNEEDILTLSEFCQVKHTLRYDEQSLQWISSNGGDMNIVRTHLDETKVSVLAQKALVGLDDRLVLLSAEPGMGKSTLMTHLAKQAKEDSPFMWTIAISLCDQTTLFAKNAHEDVSEFLAEASGISSHLHKKLFKFALEVSGNVTVLLDGYDEVTPTYVNECGLLLSNLLKTNAKKIWITSRSSFQTRLEGHLSTLAVKLKKFNEADQRSFCKGFWKEARIESSTTAISEKKLDDFITSLINLMSRDIRDKEKEILGIPLQTRMMAEIYQDHVTGAVEMPTLNKMDLLQLLEAFVDKKIRLNLARQKVLSTDVNYKSTLKKSKKESVKKHVLAALISFFGHDSVIQFISGKKITKSQKFFNDIKCGKDKTGIIENILEHEPRFIHRVFMEYFVALWFAKNFSDHTQFLEKNLYSADFDIIRNIFDRMLAKDCQLHIAVLDEDELSISELLSRNHANAHDLDLGGRSALHLAAAYGTSKDEIENYKRNRILSSLIIILQNSLFEKDVVLKSAPYRYADITKSWTTVEKLLPDVFFITDQTRLSGNLEDQSRLESIFTHDLANVMLLLINSGLPVDHTVKDIGQRLISRACCCRSYRVVNALVNKKANIHRLDNEDESPLHIASKRGNHEIVQLLCGRAREPYFENSLLDNFSSYYSKYVNAKDKYNRTALHLAALRGHWKSVDVLFKFGGDIKLRDGINGSTPLHYAAVSSLNDDRDYTVNNLISHLDFTEIELYVNMRNDDGDTALHWAAEEGCLNAVKELVQSGSQIDKVNFDGLTPLILAAENGYEEVVSYLIKQCQKGIKNYVNMQDVDGLTSLQHSAMFGHTGVMANLIEHGANTSHRDCDGDTALHTAAINGHKNAVKYLLETVKQTERAVFANVTNNLGKTALDLATKEKNEDVVNILVEFNTNLTNTNENQSTQSLHSVGTNASDEYEQITLQMAAGRGWNEVVTKMIDTKDRADRVAYVNSCDQHGNTALHWAAQNECSETVNLLIKAGANVDFPNLNLETPLIFAADKGNLDVIKSILRRFDETKICKEVLLKSAKDDFINSRDRHGWTALHYASNGGHTDALAFLIDQGGDIRAIIKESMSTSLHFGAKEGHSSVVNVLINACPVEIRADYVDLADKYGNTALLLAAANTTVKSVDLLVKAGSNISHTNHVGQTALMFAAECSDEIVKCLLEKFEDLSQKQADLGKEDVLFHSSETSKKSKYINSKDKDGLTALRLAASAGNKDVLVSFISHGANLRIRGGIDDSTSLHLACQGGYYDFVNAILDAVPNEETSSYLNTVDSDGNTALHVAACEVSVEIISLLIQSGSNVFAENSNKDTPLSLAAINGQLDVVKCLLESCDTDDKRENQKESMTIEYINKSNNDGETALCLAVSEDHADVVKYLIDQGAEIINFKKRFVTGNSLLHIAAENGNECIVNVLINTLKSKDFRHLDGVVSHSCNGKKKSRCVSYNIVDNYIDRPNDDGLTALYLAVAAGSVECVSHIVTAGANGALGDYFKQTPLMVAAWKGYLVIVKYLVDNCNNGKNGLDKRDYILLRDSHGRTALRLAEEGSHSEVMGFLNFCLLEQLREEKVMTRQKRQKRQRQHREFNL